MLRLLLSPDAALHWSDAIAAVLGERPHRIVLPGHADAADIDVALVTRDVTGLSTKHDVRPDTRAFYDLLLAAPRLRWVHIHSAGADRPVYVELRRRGVQVSTSSGTNAPVVAQTALLGVLALARRWPDLLQAQRERRWAPLIASGLPRDLQGQTAVIVGWGPVGREIARLLAGVGLRVIGVRRGDTPDPAFEVVAATHLHAVLPRADWLVLACPLTNATRGLIDAGALSLLPAHAHVVNVARGEVVDEPALVDALREHRLAGAYLDVFAHEPLDPDSPLWSLPNVIVTPHSAGFSDGNAQRVARLFLDNLARWRDGGPLANVVA